MPKKLMGIHHVTALTNRMQTIDSVITDLLGLVPIHQRVNPPVGDDQTKAYGLFNHSRAPYLNFFILLDTLLPRVVPIKYMVFLCGWQMPQP